MSSEILILDESDKAKILKMICEDIKKIPVEVSSLSSHMKQDTSQKLIETSKWTNRPNPVSLNVMSNSVKLVETPRQVLQVFEKIGVDLIKMPKVNGYKYIVVAIDYCSNWCEARPLQDKCVLSVARFLYDDIICRHGCPKIQIRDQGLKFTDDLNHELFRLTGTKIMVSSATSSMVIGLDERQNRMMKNSLLKVLQSYVQKWPFVLQGVLFALRTTPHFNNKSSPFFMLYKREANLPVDKDQEKTLLNTRSENKNKTSNSNLSNQNIFMKKLNQMVAMRDLIEDYSKKKIKELYRQGSFKSVVKPCQSIYEFKKNDKVLLKTNNDSFWRGPYTIVSINVENICVLKNKSSKILKTKHHLSKLKLFEEVSTSKEKYKELNKKANSSKDGRVMDTNEYNTLNEKLINNNLNVIKEDAISNNNAHINTSQFSSDYCMNWRYEREFQLSVDINQKRQLNMSDKNNTNENESSKQNLFVKRSNRVTDSWNVKKDHVKQKIEETCTEQWYSYEKRQTTGYEFKKNDKVLVRTFGKNNEWKGPYIIDSIDDTKNCTVKSNYKILKTKHHVSNIKIYDGESTDDEKYKQSLKEVKHNEMIDIGLSYKFNEKLIAESVNSQNKGTVFEQSTVPDDDDDDDIVCTDYFVLNKDRVFNPVSKSWQDLKCRQFNLPLTSYLNFKGTDKSLGRPLKVKYIRGDGNCFYRSICYWITGSEEYHLVIRELISEVIKNNEDVINYIGGVQQHKIHLEENPIEFNGVWASDVEIFGAVLLLNTSIYIYSSINESWQLFNKHMDLRIPTPKTEKCLYLRNYQNLHYDVVLNVKSA